MSEEKRPSLAEARRVAEAATEGPWFREYGDVILSTPDPQSLAEGYEDPQRARVFRRARHLPQNSPQAIADAAFAVGSRTLVPAMEQALRAVLAVHVRMDANGGSWCGVCADPVTQFDTFQMWPCKTVRAITQYIAIETGDAR